MGHRQLRETAGSGSGAATTKTNDADDENRFDFELLKSLLSSSSSISTIDSSAASSAATWPLHLNVMFADHYIMGESLGRGSYAEVRECVDTCTLERCAAKIVNKDYLRRQSPNALRNQLQEIRLLRCLSHPNIIALRECLFKGSKIYLILEYCVIQLAEMLACQPARRLCVPVARNVFRQLMLGINFLHSRGVIHRDIKPQNILLTSCGVVKIIDFGVSYIQSQWSHEDEQALNYEGSPLFQAPEVVGAQLSTANSKVDVWSAGVTLYLALFGDYPFIDNSLLGLYDKIVGQPLVVPRDVECELAVRDLLNEMLHKEPWKRATSDRVLKHPWLSLREYSCDKLCDFNEFALSITSRTDRNENNDSDEPARGDIYRSMSVIPYLFTHHFPELLVHKSGASSRASSPGRGSTSSGCSTVDEVVSDSPIEWGTESQYTLLKRPTVRANRLRSSRRSKSRHRREQARQ